MIFCFALCEWRNHTLNKNVEWKLCGTRITEHEENMGNIPDESNCGRPALPSICRTSVKSYTDPRVSIALYDQITNDKICLKHCW